MIKDSNLRFLVKYVFVFVINTVSLCSFGQVGVTIQSNSVPLCVSSDYSALNSISITENTVASINFAVNTTNTLIFVLSSSNFSFELNSGSVTAPGFTSATITVTASQVTVSLVTATDRSTVSDVITISGLKVKTNSVVGETVDIRQLGGTLGSSPGLADGTSVYSLISYSNRIMANAGSDVSICNFSSVQLGGNRTATGGGGSYRYLWTPTTGLNNSTASNPTFKATSVGDQTYTVTVTDINDCSSSTDVIVTVVDLPGVPNVTNASQTICSGSSTSLTPITVLGGNLEWYSDVDLANGLQVDSPSSPSVADLKFNISIANTYTAYVRQSVTASGITCKSEAVAVSLKVNALPTGNAGSNVSICNFSSVQLGGNPTATGGGGSYTYSWSPTTGLNESTVSNPTFNATSVGDQTYTVTVTDRNGCSANANVKVTVNPLPAVANKPTISGCAGTNIPRIDFVADTGSGTTFSWSVVNSTNLGLSTGMGTTNNIPSFALASNNSGDVVSGLATVVATKNNCNSSPMTFSINILPTPVGIASSTMPNICSGLGYTIEPTEYMMYNSVTSTYSWTADYKTLQGGKGTGTGSIVETTDLKNFTNQTVNIDYQITPRSTAGCVGTLFTIIVPLLSAPKGIGGTIPQICSRASVGFNLQAYLNSNQGNFQPSSFSWKAQDNILISGESNFDVLNTTISDVLTNTSGSNQIVIYNVTPTGTNGCVGPSFDMQVNILSEPKANPSTTIVAVCSKSAFSFEPISQITNGLTAGTTFSWSATYPTGIIGGKGSGNGIISETLTQKTSSVINVIYTVTPTSGTCKGSDFTIRVPVNPEPVGVAKNATLCSRAVTNLALSTTVASVAAASYNISVNSNGLGLSSGVDSGGNGKQSNEILDDAWKNDGNSPVEVVYTITPVSQQSCAGDPFSVNVMVNPEPKGNNSSISVCSGDTKFDYNLASNLANNVGSTFEWIVKTDNTNVGGESLTLQGKPTIKDVLVNTTNSNQMVTYTVTPTSSNSCKGSDFTISVNVLPTPVGSSVDDNSICSKSTFTYNLQNNIFLMRPGLNSTFSWSATYPTGIIGGKGSGNGNISETLTQKTSSVINVIYTVTPTSGTCKGSDFTIRVPVNPEPVGLAWDVAICSGSATNLMLQTKTTSVNATSYNIVVNSNGLTLPLGGDSAGNGKQSNEIYDDKWENINSIPVEVVYTITPVSQQSCSGDPFSVNVIVNPEPVGINQTVSICSDATLGYDLISVVFAGNNVGSNFEWYATNNLAVTGESNGTQNGPKILDILTNDTNSDQIVNYTIKPKSTNGCLGKDFIISVTVHPRPIGFSTNAPTICSQSYVSYSLQNNINTMGNRVISTFTWSSPSDIEGLEGESTVAQTTMMIDDFLINTSSSQHTVKYTVYPKSVNFRCDGSPFDIYVTVNPKVQVSAGPDIEICQNITSTRLEGAITNAPNGVIWSGGAGLFGEPTSPNTTYSYVASEINKIVILTFTGNDPDGNGPCKAETDMMALKINPLPIVKIFKLPDHVSQTPLDFARDIIVEGNNRNGEFKIFPDVGNLVQLENTQAGDLDRAKLNPNDGPPGVYNVTYSFTDVNGCFNSVTEKVIVNPKPQVDFSVENAAFDPEKEQYQVCSGSGRLKLFGSPPVSDGKVGGITNFELESAPEVDPLNQVTIIPLSISTDNGEFYIETEGVTSGIYTVKYTFEDKLDAINFYIKSIKISARPTPIIINLKDKYCKDGVAMLTSGSTIENNTIKEDIIEKITWNFQDDGEIFVGPKVEHVFARVGTFQVMLTAQSGGTRNCESSITQMVSVDSLNRKYVSYSAFSFCSGDTTFFEDQTPLPPHPKWPNSSIVSYTWDFGDNSPKLTGSNGENVPSGTDQGRTTGTFVKPKHYYNDIGKYSVSLSIVTDFGCKGAVKKPIAISPSVTVTKSAPYVENFDNSDGGWVAPDSTLQGQKIITSWMWSDNKETGISTATSGDNFWWTGKNNRNGNNSSYYPLERSYLIGPCLNISALERPMIAFDYRIDTQEGFDGTVAQYFANGINEKKTWSNIGVKDQGVNWYNSSNYITSNPGDQNTILPVGWNGEMSKSEGWIDGRFNLDDISFQSRNNIQIRFAFASNGENPIYSDFKGFALDNVFIGEKTKNVLVEHFTNSNIPEEKSGDEYIRGLYSKQISNPLTSNNGRLASDFYYIQYHIPYLSDDELYTNNPLDQSSRALMYNVQNPPTTIMDGIIDGKNLNGSYNKIDKFEIDSRALISPLFNIELDTIPTNDSHTINVKLKIIPNKTTSKYVLVQVALVEMMEKQIKDGSNVVYNVFNQNLLGITGLLVSETFNLGRPKEITTGNVKLVTPIKNPNNLILVAYVQDRVTEEIYQTAVSPAPSKRNLTITTGIDQDKKSQLNNLSVFPIPATRKINVGVNGNAGSEFYTWKLINLNGVVVKSGNFISSDKYVGEIEVSDLTNGVYFIEIYDSNKSSFRKKIIVLN